MLLGKELFINNKMNRFLNVNVDMGHPSIIIWYNPITKYHHHFNKNIFIRVNRLLTETNNSEINVTITPIMQMLPNSIKNNSYGIR